MTWQERRKFIVEIEQELANRLFLEYGSVLLRGDVDGFSVGVMISSVRDENSWTSPTTDRYTIKIGIESRTHTYRQLKKGGFNYDKIIAELHEQATNAMKSDDARSTRRAKLANNRVRQKLVDARHTYTTYPHPISSTINGIDVKFTTVTTLQADQLLVFAEAIGIII